VSSNQFETNLIFYRIYNGYNEPEDYLNWSHALLANGIESKSLSMLASMNSMENKFLFDQYFKRALSELTLTKPTFIESA